MTEQLTIADYQKRRTYERDGSTYEAPEWMDDERCETCKYWELLPKDEQPPAGWGVKGQCNFLHTNWDGTRQTEYQNTGKTSYCQEWEGRYGE